LAPKNKMKGRDKKFDWQVTMHQAGHTLHYTGLNITASTETQCKDAYRQEKYGLVEMALQGGMILQVRQDGDLVYDRSWPGVTHDPPSVYDKSRGDTSNERIMRYMVTRKVPHFAEMFPEALEEYVDEEAAAEIESTSASIKNPTPGNATPGERIEFPAAKEISTG